MLRFISSVQILPWTVYPVLLNDFATCLIKNSRQFAPCSYLSYIQRQNLIHQPFLQMHDITSLMIIRDANKHDSWCVLFWTNGYPTSAYHVKKRDHSPSFGYKMFLQLKSTSVVASSVSRIASPISVLR